MFPNVNFKHIEDLWLNVLVISVFLYSLTFYSHLNSTKYLTILFFITSVTVLLNPIIALTMMIVVAIFLFKSYLIKSVSFSHSKNSIASISYFLKSRFALRFFRDIMIITISCLLTLSIWSYRNYRTFGKFIPVKSNFWFEFYMSNVIDDDGILSWSTLCKFHPTAGVHLESLSQMGEIKWMETWEDSSKLFIQQNPRIYLNNIFNRFVNSFLYTETVKDYHEIKIYDNIPESDRLILTKARLISDNMWIDLEMDNYKAETRFNGLNLSDKTAVYNDWQEAKRTLTQRRYSLPYIVKSLMMSLIPALSFLFLLFFKRIRKLCLYQVAVSFYILYLIPYIISSHETRYQKTLFIIQVLIVYIAYIEINNYLRKKYPRLFPAFLTGIKTKE